MAVVFTEARQLGLADEVSFRFQRELVEMTRTLGRPLPELRGGLMDGVPGDPSWLVECTIRPPLTTPTAPVYVYCVIERSWNDGAVRVIQETIARLAYQCDYRFVGTRFELLGRRDAEGEPIEYQFDPAGLGPHLEDMEFLLHYTQSRLDSLRVEYGTTSARNRALEGQLRTIRLDRNRLVKKVEALQSANAILRGRLKTARADLATRDSAIEELEEENTGLRKENEDLLPDDDIPSDDMDVSEPSEPEDDDLLGDEEDPEEILFEGEVEQD